MNYHVKHFIGIAKPSLEAMIREMSPTLARWIRYDGVELIANNRLYFKFVSSAVHLEFKIYAGVGNEDLVRICEANTDVIYDTMRTIKYEAIKVPPHSNG